MVGSIGPGSLVGACVVCAVGTELAKEPVWEPGGRWEWERLLKSRRA